MILQQNSALEKKIADLEAEKSRIEQNMVDAGSKQQEQVKTLEIEIENLKNSVNTVQEKIDEREKDLKSAELRWVCYQLHAGFAG